MPENNKTALESIDKISQLLPQLDNALFGENAPEGSNDILAEISKHFKTLSQQSLFNEDNIKNKIIGLQAQMDVILQKTDAASSKNKSEMQSLIQRAKAQNSYTK